MRRKVFFSLAVLIIVLLICPGCGFSRFGEPGIINPKHVQTLPGIIKPDAIAVAGDRLFIVENAAVSIYSLEDFRCLNKFGKAGEGPQEFKPYPLIEAAINLVIEKEFLFIGSEKKISYFSRSGDFIKEKRMNDGMAFNWKPLGENFVAMLYKPVGNVPYFTFNCFDSSSRKVREICTRMIPHYKKDNTVLWGKLAYTAVSDFQIHNSRILVASAEDFKIQVFDQDGNLIKMIKKGYTRRKVTTAERLLIEAAWQESPYIKKNWDDLRKIIRIPGSFPAIKRFFIADDKIYVQTYKTQRDETEFVVFDLEGNYIKTLFLPLAYKNIIDPYAYCISGGILYQVVENQDTENWELNIEVIGNNKTKTPGRL